MSTRILPYASLNGDLEFSPTQAEVQVGSGHFQIPNEHIDHNVRAIDLTLDHYSQFSEARLEFEMTIPKTEYEVLANQSNPVDVVVVAYCATTNSRISVSATQSSLDKTHWSATLVLSKAQFRDSIQIKAILTGPVGGLPCRFLGESAAWTIYIDPGSAAVVRGNLPVKWVDFGSDDSRPFLKAYADEPWYADLTDSQPCVYLNKNFKYLPELFGENTRHSKAQSALNEAQRTAIAKGIWLAMFQAAVAQIVPGENDGDPSWPNGWRAAVLSRILPKVYADVEENEGLRLAYEARNSDGAERLESEALAVIGRDIVKEGKNLRKALTAVMASEEV